jgi:hypothetical protein
MVFPIVTLGLTRPLNSINYYKLLFYAHSRVFQLFRNVTIAGEGLQNLGLGSLEILLFVIQT